MTEKRIINPDLGAGRVFGRYAVTGTLIAAAALFPGGGVVIATASDGSVSVKTEWRADLDAVALPGPQLRDHVVYQTLALPSSTSAIFSASPLWVMPSGSS